MRTARTAFALAAAVAAAAVASAAGTSATTTRISASIAARPGVSGVFVGTLTGRTLTWRVRLSGVRAPVLHVRAGRFSLTLCTPCARSARGTITVPAATASALAKGRAYLELKPLQATSPRVQAQIVQGVPTLEITSLHDGDSITLPAQVAYRIANFPVGLPPLGSVRVSAPGVAPIALAVTGAEGTLMIPDAKATFLVGHRDLTFTLVTADGTPVPNAEARVTVRGVTVQGRR